MSSRAWSTTSHVCSSTGPSGCHSNSCGTPIKASISGKSCRVAPSFSSHLNPTEGRRARKMSFSISPQMRSDGRSDKSIERHSSTVANSTSNSKRAANCAARSTRRESSGNVSWETARSSFPAMSARPSKGSMISPVSGSSKIALMVKSRRLAASSIVIEGSPSTTKARWPRPVLRSRRGRDTSTSGPSL